MKQIENFKRVCYDNNLPHSFSNPEAFKLKAFNIGISNIEKMLTLGEAILCQLKGTIYEKRLINILKLESENYPDDHRLYIEMIDKLYGIIDALEDNIKNNFLDDIVELIHGEVFNDFLDMAEHLLETENGYKDPSAVIIGSTLETHLKKLAKKHNIAITSEISKNKKRYKAAGKINEELLNKKAYNIVDSKNITKWLELRNNAAHGDYDSYSKEKVELMLDGVKNLISKTLA